MSMDRLALIILNYNSYEDTVRCVDRLLSFKEDYRIVVVDNNSPDGSGERLQARYNGTPDTDVILSDRNGGYGAGNNIGIRFADERFSADTVAIINPDVDIPASVVLRTLYDKLNSNERYGIIGACLTFRDGSFNLNYSAWNIPTPAQIAGKQSLFTRRYKIRFKEDILEPGVLKTECIAGCFFMARMDVMKQIGLFDENMFMFNEEDAIGIRCRDAGYLAVLMPDQHYYHDHHTPSKEGMTFSSKVHDTADSYVTAKYLCRKYYNGKGLVRLWIVEVINRIYLALAYFKYKITGV